MKRISLAALALWATCAVHATDIVIGQAAPLTGTLASTGADMVLGAKIYFDSVNAQGGVAGRQIRHVVKDDGYRTEETVRLTRELIEKDKAVGLIGYAGTGNIAEVLKQGILSTNKVPLIAPYTGGEPLRKPFNPYIFHIRAGYADEVAKMVEQFSNVGLKRIAVFYQNDAFGLAGLTGVENAMSKQNLTLVGRASYEKGTEDVSAAVASISKAAPQAVLMIAVVRPAAAFVREYRKIDRATQLFSISVISGAELFALTGDTIASGIGITQVVPSPYGNSLKVVQEYRAALKKYAPKAKPSYTSLEEFIGAKVLVEGLRRVKGEITGEALRLALESVNVDTGGFNVRFSPDNHIGSDYVQVTVIGRDGRILN
jgi:ABC-type branched-subunit amino acid transport system substrate-binding protein